MRVKPRMWIGKLGKLTRAAFRLEAELGREPTDDELAAEVGMTSSSITQMRTAAIHPTSLDVRLFALVRFYDPSGLWVITRQVPCL
jgi:DNA-directed RNA polymerase sigma subunit (sigma70/sigma32)